MSPLHDYQCQHCAHVFEVQTPFRRLEDMKPCPRCGSYLAIRQPAAPAFVVKGYSAKSGYSKKED